MDSIYLFCELYSPSPIILPNSSWVCMLFIPMSVTWRPDLEGLGVPLTLYLPRCSLYHPHPHHHHPQCQLGLVIPCDVCMHTRVCNLLYHRILPFLLLSWILCGLGEPSLPHTIQGWRHDTCLAALNRRQATDVMGDRQMMQPRQTRDPHSLNRLAQLALALLTRLTCASPASLHTTTSLLLPTTYLSLYHPSYY